MNASGASDEPRVGAKIEQLAAHLSDTKDAAFSRQAAPLPVPERATTIWTQRSVDEQERDKPRAGDRRQLSGDPWSSFNRHE
ncbi:MAG: hypothetical protein HC841_09635 [Verrucomicrobiae bacterium]|nr:hypothetical protein [Verrucomicrobiae bacterium]